MLYRVSINSIQSFATVKLKKSPSGCTCKSRERIFLRRSEKSQPFFSLQLVILPIFFHKKCFRTCSSLPLKSRDSEVMQGVCSQRTYRQLGCRIIHRFWEKKWGMIWCVCRHTLTEQSSTISLLAIVELSSGFKRGGQNSRLRVNIYIQKATRFANPAPMKGLVRI